MSKPNKPALRMAPQPFAIAEQQKQALLALKSLQSWTEEPMNPPVQGEVRVSEPKAIPKPKKEPEPAIAPVLEASKWPWDEVSPEALHQYSFFLPKSLFLKADYCWKRGGSTSMKVFVADAIEAYCNAKLKEFGDKP